MTLLHTTGGIANHREKGKKKTTTDLNYAGA